MSGGIKISAAVGMLVGGVLYHLVQSGVFTVVESVLVPLSVRLEIE